MGPDPPQSQRQSITQARDDCQDPQGIASLTGHGPREGGTHETTMGRGWGQTVQVRGLSIAKAE